MAKLYAEKCRLCRASEKKLFLKGSRCFSNKCPITKKGAVLPGQKGTGRKRKKSDYGVRLIETQKLKKIYGIGERRLKNYFADARKEKESTGEALLQLLELRLDNVVYRLGFVPSRRSARQLVSHKHILVDGKKVNIASFKIKPGQVISLDGKAIKTDLVTKSLENKDYIVPVWLEKKAGAGKASHLPKKNEIDTDIDEQLVIEFYSRK